MVGTCARVGGVSEAPFLAHQPPHSSGPLCFPVSEPLQPACGFSGRENRFCLSRWTVVVAPHLDLCLPLV